MEIKTVGLVLLLAAVVHCVPFDKELSRDRREGEGEGPVVVVETGGRGRGRNPFFRNPFFDDDSDETFPSFGDDSLEGTPSRPGGSGFGGFGMGMGPSIVGSDFFNKMNNWMRDLQRKMNTMWDQIYRQRLPNFPNVHNVGPVGTDFDSLPPNYHNSTSTRKVVNGSVIVVNQTIHKEADNNSHSFVHVKVIHMTPEEGATNHDSEHKPPQHPHPEIEVPDKEFEEFPRPAGPSGGEFDVKADVSSPKTVETSTEERNNEII